MTPFSKHLQAALTRGARAPRSRSLLFLRLDFLLAGAIMAATLTWTVASPAPAGDAQSSSTALSDSVKTRPLRFLMASLGQDMSRVGDGIWREDFEMIEKAARDISDHPRITPEEVAAIKAALQRGFQQFVGIDRVVHLTAAELASAAAVRDLGRVLELQGQLQSACVACHTAYRDDVRAALY